ncbi:MAG: PPE domain-containing protein [Pseudonocardiaceae bacterium]
MGTNFTYDNASHQVIFDQLNSGAGSDALQEISRSWQQLGDGVGTNCKSFVQNSISGILAARQGVAADAAAAATGAMLPWMDTLQQTTAAVAQRAQGQAEHWVTAKNSVPPVPPTPQPTGFVSDPGEWTAEKLDWFPGITSNEEDARLRQQDAEEQARQAMRVYQSNSNDNIDVAPAFTPPQALDASVGSLPLTNPSIDPAGSPPPTIAIAGGGTPAYLSTAHQPAAPPPAHQPATYQPAATVSQLAQTAPAATSGSLVPPNQWTKGGAPGPGIAPGEMPISAGFSAASTGRARPVTTRGSVAGQRFGGAGGGGHAGFGPRPSTGFGPRPSAQAALDEMSTTRSSAGPGSAIRNASEAGYGQPFGGATNQQGERDREHHSKYLIHEDPTAIVGDLPPTAPPVIGADY